MTTSSDKPDPPFVKICSRCRLVHDDRESWATGWLTKKAYRDATGIDFIACRLKHGFCPACEEYFVQKAQAA